MSPVRAAEARASFAAMVLSFLLAAGLCVLAGRYVHQRAWAAWLSRSERALDAGATAAAVGTALTVLEAVVVAAGAATSAALLFDQQILAGALVAVSTTLAALLLLAASIAATVVGAAKRQH